MAVLKAAQSVKVNIQTSCGKGICGTCRVKLASGTVTMNHGGGIKQREIDQGYILACCSKPTSNLVIDR
jgi:ferredoxin